MRNLPNECIASILELCSPSDLYALCLVNKRIRAWAEPLLYRSIEWVWSWVQTPPILLLLRSLFERPQLSNLIHSILLHGTDFYVAPFKGKPPPTIAFSDPCPGLEHAIRFVEKTGVAYAESWTKELRRGNMDALVAVLLAQLTELRSLRLTPNFFKESRFFGCMMASSLCEPRSHALSNFEHLRDVAVYRKLDHYRDKNDRNTENALPLFYLPSLQRLSISIDDPLQFAWPTSQPNAAGITALAICSSMRESQLGHLLSVTTGLRMLRWRWWYSPDFEDQNHTDIVDLEQLASALSHVSGTLTELELSAKCFTGNEFLDLPYVEFKGSLSKLANFSQLKTYKLPWTFLLGFNPALTMGLGHGIPTNVQNLTLIDDLQVHEENVWEDDELFDQFRLWLQSNERTTSSLRHVSFEFCLGTDEWWYDLPFQLRRMSPPVGVEMEIKIERV